MRSIVIPSRSKELLYSKVADSISEYIGKTGLKAGDKLPSERILSQMLGASRNSVREALRELENQGVITVQPGRGSFLTGSTADKLSALRFVSRNFLEQLEVKMLVEQQIVRHAVRGGASDAQKKELVDVASQLVALSETGIYPEQMDMYFHNKLSKCTPNNIMTMMMQDTIQLFADYWHEFFSSYWDNMQSGEYSLSRTLPFHLELANAITEGDEQKAVEAYNKIYETDVCIFNKIQG